MADPMLKAPFPYYGGKSKVAVLVWERLGDVAHYIEPFCGSAAMMLKRPTPARIETINDVDCYVTNFWRCVRDLPAVLAELCNYPVSELDLHASHRWLVGVTKPLLMPDDWKHGADAWFDACELFRGHPNDAAITFRERMRNEPDYRDPLYAARWVWGICQWIGGGWCQTRDDETGQVDNEGADEDAAVSERRPMTGGFEGQTGQGIHGSKGIKLGGIKTTFEIMPGHPEKGIHAGKPLDESLPAISGGPVRGIHQAGTLEEPRPIIGDAGRGIATGAVGRPANWERLPDMQKCDGGRGLHQVGVDTYAEQMPTMEACRTTGKGIHGVGDFERALSEGRAQLADAFDIGRGIHSGKLHGTMAARLSFLERWFHILADRLRLVRVCCGDWRRVVGSESVTTRLGLCGIFLDPPYGVAAKRDSRLYGSDSLTVAEDVRAWCIENGPNPKMRIALCGYEDEHRVLSEVHGWDMVEWESKGYGNRTAAGKENQKKERIWFSPHCLKPAYRPVSQNLFE